MPKDFKASQIRSSKLIGSGTSAPGLLIYSASDASNFEGGYQADMLTNVGSDVFLFVSGAKNDRSGVTLFGGDVVVSGTMYMERLIAEVDLTSTGSAAISGSLFVSASATLGGGLIVNNSDDMNSNSSFTVIGDRPTRHLIHADPSQSFVHILSGGGGTSADQTTATDTSFFVSGTIGSKASGVRGVSVFGGDVVVSGSLTDGAGNPIVGGGEAGVGWFSGSSATHGSLGIQPDFISTSGSLAVSGTNLDIAGNIRHIGDTNTAIEFGTSDINLKANNLSLVRALKDGSTSEGVFVGATGQSLGTMISGGAIGAHMIIPASKKQFLFMSGGAATSINQADGRDVVFHVSGAIGSKGTTSRGTAVFGGDLVVSGALHASSITGSLSRLDNGKTYLIGSGSVTLSTASDGQVFITGDGGGFHRSNSAERVFLQNTNDKIMIGGNPANSAPSGKMEINVKTSENITGLFIDYNNTGGNSALVVDSESTSSPAVNIQGFKGLIVEQTADEGYAAEFSRNRNDAGSNPLVNIHDDHTANEQTALRVRQDGTGDILRLSDGAIEVVRFKDGGRVNFGHDHESQDAPGEGTDVRFFVSGSVDGKSKGLANSVAVCGGDLAVSGAIYGTSEDESGNEELALVSDVVTLGSNIEIPNFSQEIFFFVSGSTPSSTSFDNTRSKSLFEGSLVTSGNISVVQNYAATGAQLSLNNLTSITDDGGSVRIDMLAGESLNGGDNVKLFIQKAGAGNSMEQGGPYANVFRGGSGSMVFVVGATEAEYKGDQPFIFRDMHGTFFMATTGSAALGDASVYFLSGGAASSTNIAAMDTNFIVSGAIGSAGLASETQAPGTALFGGDLVVSGALQVKNGAFGGGTISGSIHHTDQGKSYLIAGDNVTITSASDGSITIGASGGGGSSAFVSGSTTINSVTSIDVTRLGLLTNLGSGEIAITGTIGPPEDGTYEDGLFTSFNSDTQIGHAIDKINEVLFFLSPSPAPNLAKIGNDGLAGIGDGTNVVRLSIGSSNDSGGAGVTVVGGGAGFGESRDINDSYHIATSSNNIRMGVFTSKPTITGFLADGVAANTYTGGVINHSGSAFGDADQGELKLFINGFERHAVDLTLDSAGSGEPGSGTKNNHEGNNNGFFNFSQTGSAVQANGQEFGLFKYRTGKVRITDHYQRAGWNYAQVVHTVNGVDRSTNQLEWFVDEIANQPTSNAVAIQDVKLSGSQYISGIQYATGAEGKYFTRIDNFYDHVYALNSATFTTTNVDSVPSVQVPQVANYSDSFNAKILLSSSFQLAESSINAGTMASGSVTYNFTLNHPTKNNMTNTGSITSSEFLIYSASSFATEQFEDFVYETRRLPSASYDTQASLSSPAVWDSTLHLTDSSVSGHADGLAFYAGKLKSASQTTAQGGNFTIFASGAQSAFALRPERQPNYSTGGAATGTKTFFRRFKNETGSSKNSFKLSFTGSNSTTIVPKGGTLNSSNIRVYVKNPQNTGYLDLATAFKPVHLTGQFQVSDYDGLNVGTFTDTLGGSTVTNFCSFGTGSVPNDGFIVLKVEADASWAGHIGDLNVEFGAFNESAVVNAPELEEIDITSPNDFVAAKLSFGAGTTQLSNFIPVTGSSAAGGPYGLGTDVDFNGNYTISTAAGANKRYGVNSSNGDVEDVIGDLNPDVVQHAGSSGKNYTAKAFRFAQGGTLSLFVNASGSGVTPIHSVDLATFAGAGVAGSGTGQSLNSNGSGFINISFPTPATSSDGSLPDFTKFFRTAQFKVTGSDQNPRGWNWAQVVHSIGGGQPDEVTTFVEWVNDDDGSAVDITANESGSFDASGFYYQSGVKYFNTALSPVATGTVKYRVADAYTNVYSNSDTALRLNPITNFTAQGIFVTGSSVVDKGDVSLTSNGTSLPALIADQAVDADIHVTGTLTYTGGTSLPLDSSINSQTFTTVSPNVTLNVDHPIDTNADQQVVFSNFLAYSGTVGSSNINTTEKFTGEYFRMRSGSFANQAASGSLKWDSTQSLVGADAAHNTGLLVYGNDGSNGFLVSPKKTALPNGGDFRPFNDLNSPQGNVNYSGASGERHYFRTFKNNTASDQAVITVVVKGDANLVPRTGAGSASLGSNKNVYIFVKIPGKTGWLDIAKPADGTITDGGGALQGDRDATIDNSGASNEVTFSTAFVGGDPSSNDSGEYFCLAVHADSEWTGHIEEISVTF